MEIDYPSLSLALELLAHSSDGPTLQVSTVQLTYICDVLMIGCDRSPEIGSVLNVPADGELCAALY